MLPGNNAAERPPSLRSAGDVVVRGTNATIKTVNGTAASLNRPTRISVRYPNSTPA